MKFAPFVRRTGGFALAAALVLHSGLSAADDTEIFFGSQAVSDDARPNVLVILDDSGSMAWCLNNNTACSSNNRMQVLKSTMQNLLDTTSGVNMGLMVLNNSVKSPSISTEVRRLLHPVTNIDGAYNVKIAGPEIKSSGDDVSRYGNGTLNSNDPVLLMGHIKNPSPTTNPAPTTYTVTRHLGDSGLYSNHSTYRVNGSYACSVRMAATDECSGMGVTNKVNVSKNPALLLFRNLNIPADATITSATLRLKREGSSTAPTTFAVKALQTKTPEAFNDSTTFTAFPSGSNIQTTESGGYGRLEIKDLLNALRTIAPAANPIGDLALRLETSTTTYELMVGDIADAPELTIEYTPGTESERKTALRFQTVSVPQGASITRATLSFVPASSDDRPLTLNVSAKQGSGSLDVNSTGLTPTEWIPTPWTTQNPPVYSEEVDVTSRVQEVVSDGGWCGNEAMDFFLEPLSGEGSRTAISWDGNNDLKPMLDIQYTGGDSGCMKPIAEMSLIDGKDDGRQYYYDKKNTTYMVLDESFLDLSKTDTYLAARYQRVPFRKGAVPVSVSVIVTPNTASGTTATAEVYFEKAANSAAFTTTNNNFGSRTPTTAKASCTFTSLGVGIPVECSSPQLADSLKEVLGQSGWADGNALTLLIKRGTANSSLSLRAYELSPADAIRLRVQFSSRSDLTDAGYKSRNYLKGLVDTMKASGGTPLVELLYQGASYYTARKSKHKGPDSPIQSSCQANFLVLMTDGAASGNSETTVKNAMALVDKSSCETPGKQDELCGVDIARWLNTVDQSLDLEGLNTVTTHTVGFALGTDAKAITFLNNVASAGGGKSYNASNASELSNAFSQIIREALATDTTFVSAAVPVNSFNRTDHKDELYFSLFRPSSSDRWPGNIKRYKMGVRNDLPLVLDQDNTPAVDTSTGFFRGSARSWWTATADGSDVAAGGAAKQLPAPTSRKILTNKGGVTTTALVSLDTNITPAELGASDNTERNNMINFIRGFEAGSSTTRRLAIGDPIHSTPSLVTYKCETKDADGNCTKETQSAVVGTNEGFVQIFDANTGVEQAAFMPWELRTNIKRLYLNAETKTNDHIYGMDSSVTLWVNDKDKDGVIGSGEFVYAYAGMGRGGRNLYALDITTPTSPTLKWVINGGSGDFSRLGQTWSQPVKARIKVGGTVKDVLILGGGYDKGQDPEKDKSPELNIRRGDGMGNDLFIVDATTGALIWSASSAGVSMNYSVPSRVAVTSLDVSSGGQAILNPEELATQIFVGDMGGQVWRFIINNGQTGTGLVSGRVFADVGGSDATNTRRFYHEPALALVQADNKLSLTVSIGSGYRGNPLNTTNQDYFYSFRTNKLASHDSMMTLSNLYDVTNMASGLNDTQKAGLKVKAGWYIKFDRKGEKVLSNAMAIGGDLYFNTFEPVNNQDACRAAQGVSRGYRVRLLDGAAIGTNRQSTLKGATLPSNPQVYCQGDTCWAYNDLSQLSEPGISAKPEEKPKSYDMASKGRLYWNEITE